MTHRTLGFGFLAGCAILAGCNDTNEPETATAPSAPSAEAPSLAVAANSWMTRANIPSVQRQGFASLPFKNSAGQYVVYLIGGQTERGASLSNLLAYNVSTNTWAWKKPLPVPLYHSNGGGVIGGKLYISGGITGHRAYSTALYMYDPVANTWTRKADMPNFGYQGVSAVINNKLYVYTDCDDAASCYAIGAYTPRFYRYDPATNKWTTLSPALDADGDPRSHLGGTGGLINGKFYVTGGESAALDVYDPFSNTWSPKASLPTHRFRVAGAIGQGKLYVIGGIDGTGTPTRTNSVYDPATNQWTDKAPMPSARDNLSASAVALNGQLRMEVLGGPTPNNLAYIP